MQIQITWRPSFAFLNLLQAEFWGATRTSLPCIWITSSVWKRWSSKLTILSRFVQPLWTTSALREDYFYMINNLCTLREDILLYKQQDNLYYIFNVTSGCIALSICSDFKVKIPSLPYYIQKCNDNKRDIWPSMQKSNHSAAAAAFNTAFWENATVLIHTLCCLFNYCKSWNSALS